MVPHLGSDSDSQDLVKIPLERIIGTVNSLLTHTPLVADQSHGLYGSMGFQGATTVINDTLVAPNPMGYGGVMGYDSYGLRGS
jgi:hypothetical protein